MIDKKKASSRRQYWISLIAVLVVAAYAIGSFGVYCARTLNGKSANHILIGEMFGIPDAIKARGIVPMYYGPGQTGWDGQFYFYMSNDLLAVKDTPLHIDAPSYRYQRVGLSLYAKTMATLAGRDWVSPNFYLFSYFLLVLAATWAGARIFAGFGASPLLILFWSLSVGTQITLYNGLPDAAADAFLILAVWALLRGRTVLSLLPFALAGLSREVYVLFPVCIFLWMSWDKLALLRQAGVPLGRSVRPLLSQRALLLLVPAVIVVLWQGYVVSHFHVTPSSQALGILGAPFKAWFDYLLSGLRGNHLLLHEGEGAYYEAASLVLFAAVLLSGAWVALRVIAQRGAGAPYPAIARGLALALLAFALMYACFGPTVIMHYTGYIKALAVFFFVVPLLLCQRGRGGLGVYVLLALTLAFTTVYNFGARILSVSPNPYQTAAVSETRRFECIGRYAAAVKVNEVRLEPGDLLARAFGHTGRMTVSVELTNVSDKPFVSSTNFGGIYMSYHWTDENGKVVKDGLRTPLPAPLQPGETVKVDVHSDLPSVFGTSTMILSPVQEACAWFYQANPESAAGQKIRVRN